jgi:hypothetical protein
MGHLDVAPCGRTQVVSVGTVEARRRRRCPADRVDGGRLQRDPPCEGKHQHHCDGQDSLDLYTLGDRTDKLGCG